MTYAASALPPALLLLPAPFLLGLNRPVAWVLWGALLLALVLLHRDARLASPPRTLLPAWLAAMLFAFALPLLQLAGGDCATLPSPWPCALDPERVLQGMALALLLALWFLLLLDTHAHSSNRLLALLALAGGLQALYGFACHYLGIVPLFMDDVFRHDTVPAGGFPNRNHFAAFLYIGIFAGIALVLRLPGDTGSGRAARWRILLDQRLLWRLLIVLMVLALIASRSRAGNTAFVAGLIAGGLWLWLVEKPRAQRAGEPGRWRFVLLLLASVLVLDALLLGSFVGLDKLQQRIGDTTLDSEIRADVNGTLLAHGELFSPAGHGAAGFDTLFEHIKPADFPVRLGQAHNDYLQAPIERGWLGVLLFAFALAWALREALRRKLRGDGAPLRFALVAATTALLLHAGVEYVTQVPVIWMAWLLLLALCLRHPEPVSVENPPAGRR